MTTIFRAETARRRRPRADRRAGGRRSLLRGLLLAAAGAAASSSCSLFASLFYGELRTVSVSASALGSVTLEADAPNESRVDGLYAFRDGTRVTLRAAPSADGVVFDSWSGGYVSYDAEFSFTVAKDADIAANFVAQSDPWLVMVYMAAANSLEADGYYDLNRMELGLAEAEPDLRGNLKVVALYDRISTADYLAANPGADTAYNSSDDGDWSGARLYELRPDDDTTELASRVIQSASSSLGAWRTGPDDEMDMGDRDTLTAFAAWATEAYPEYRRHALILWNHGSGLAASRSICFDDEVEVESGQYGSIGQLYIGELDEALEPVYGPGGSAADARLEAFGADACHLGLYEAAYELRDLAAYFVSSPAIEYGGWNYARLFSTRAAFDSGRAFVKEVVQGYRAKSPFSPNTMTGIDLSCIEDLKSAVDGLGAALLDYRDNGSAGSSDERQIAVEALRNASVAYYSGSNYDIPLYAPYHDLGDFCERVAAAGLSVGVTSAANAVLSGLSQAVVYTWTADEYGGFEGACGRGLGVFFSHGDEIYDNESHYAYQWYYTDTDTGDIDIPYGYLAAADQGAGSATWRDMLDAFY